jgi:fructan beta-fructosidase
MALAVLDHISLWGSKDLKQWNYLSEWGKTYGAHEGVWECPDLFPIEVEGTSETKWVLLQNLNPGAPNGGSGTQYFIGDFDGKKFTLDPSFALDVVKGKAVWLDYGRDNYAGVTWSDVPQSDGRRLFMGWMGNWEYAQVVPTQTWRSAMTLPRMLTLKKTTQGYRIFSMPVRELDALHAEEKKIAEAEVNGLLDLTGQIGYSPAQLELELEWTWDAATPADFGIQLSNDRGEVYRIGYDAGSKEFYCDRTRAGDHSFSAQFASSVYKASYNPNGQKIKFRVYFDVASSELFADDGAFVMTDIFFPGEDFTRVSLYAVTGKAKLLNGAAYPLDRIW